MNGMLWFLLGCTLIALVCLFLHHLDKKRRKQRVLALTAYLESAVDGQETVLSRVEDEYSMLEDELYKTVSELRIAKESAINGRKRQADNLADISHQLKTPLTSMSLMTQLLREDLSPGQLEYVQRIDRQLERLNWLTASLLTMSRLDAGTIVFERSSLSFEQLALRASEPYEQVLLERNQSLCIMGGDCHLTCDPHWTSEALLNLIKNCSEHTPADGSITMCASLTPLYAQITVEDTGPGFEPAEIPRIFQRFYRGKHAGSDSVGIGLALSRGILEGQGGIIRAENQSVKGARFIIRLYPQTRPASQ